MEAVRRLTGQLRGKPGKERYRFTPEYMMIYPTLNSLTDSLMNIKDLIFCVLQMPSELKYGSVTKNGHFLAGSWMDAHEVEDQITEF